jgi:hypothetical protein
MNRAVKLLGRRRRAVSAALTLITAGTVAGATFAAVSEPQAGAGKPPHIDPYGRLRSFEVHYRDLRVKHPELVRQWVITYPANNGQRHEALVTLPGGTAPGATRPSRSSSLPTAAE